MSHLVRTSQDIRQDLPAEHLPESPSNSSSGHSSFPGFHRPEVTTPYEDSTATPRSILPTPSKATTSTDLIGHRLQLSKQDALKSRNPLRHQVIPHFERCNGLYSSVEGYIRKQKSLLNNKVVIRVVMMKFQHANHAVMEIRMIHTTNYDSQGICTLKPTPKKRESGKPVKSYRDNPFQATSSKNCIKTRYCKRALPLLSSL